jgi:hypothetical protein
MSMQTCSPSGRSPFQFPTTLKTRSLLCSTALSTKHDSVQRKTSRRSLYRPHSRKRSTSLSSDRFQVMPNIAFAFIDLSSVDLFTVLTLSPMFNCSDIVHTPIPARASTPLAGHLSDDSRPGTPLSGEFRQRLHAFDLFSLNCHVHN